MRTRDEVEKDIEHIGRIGAGRSVGGFQHLTLEVLLDIRELLNGLDTRIASRDDDGQRARDRDDNARFQRDVLSALGQRR